MLAELNVYLDRPQGDLSAEAEIQLHETLHAGAQLLHDGIRDALVPSDAKLFQTFESRKPLYETHQQNKSVS